MILLHNIYVLHNISPLINWNKFNENVWVNNIIYVEKFMEHMLSDCYHYHYGLIVRTEKGSFVCWAKM